MNFAPPGEKWRETAGAAPATMPGLFLGGGPRAKPIQCTTTLAAFNRKKPRFRFREHSPQNRTRSPAAALSRYFAATELTWMVSPSSVPVTVAVLPACLSRVSRAALSVVCKVYTLSPTISA